MDSSSTSSPTVFSDEDLDSAAPVSSVPIHIVTNAAQLPTEFLEPSPERKLAIGFDCEGVDLCRNEKLCIMQLAFPDAMYLVDTIEGDGMLMKACEPALESEHIIKFIHDCKRDSEALYFQYGIKLNNVVDTQIAYSLVEEQEGRKKVPDDYISFVGLLADPRYCGVSYQEKKEVRILLRQDPNFWTVRPLSNMMIRAAAAAVRFLLYGVKESCKYCSHHSGKMGRVIGERGTFIMSVQESCNAEIFTGGDKGPPDKLFIMGPAKQARKAEAILRGRIPEI